MVKISISVGYIDLSKRRVSPEDITKCEERFVKSKTVASIMRYVASKLPNASPAAAALAAKKEGEGEHDIEHEEDTVGGVAEAGTGTGEEELEALYDLIAWPLGDKYGHPYDAFKLALTSVYHFPISDLSIYHPRPFGHSLKCVSPFLESRKKFSPG